jgi:6-phosphogluconolactonase
MKVASLRRSNMALTKKLFDNVAGLNATFADTIAELLTRAVAQRGTASLLVSGGRTPTALFNTLSERDLPWDKIAVSLVDERWVDEDDAASNTALVKSQLLKNKASAARFVPLKTNTANAVDAVSECEANLATMAQPFDVLILGMGEDGHTASLFPCCKELLAGLDMASGHTCIATQPTSAPHQRMSLTLPAIVASRHVFLHLTGDKKLQVLDDAMALNNETEKPITAVINRAPVTLMWAP